jgi:hypothetical protein
MQSEFALLLPSKLPYQLLKAYMIEIGHVTAQILE